MTEHLLVLNGSERKTLAQCLAHPYFEDAKTDACSLPDQVQSFLEFAVSPTCASAALEEEEKKEFAAMATTDVCPIFHPESELDFLREPRLVIGE